MGKYRDYPLYETAPFPIAGVTEVHKKVVVDRGETISHSTGEVVPSVWYKGGGVAFKDVRSYVKVFTPGLQVFAQLSYAGVIVLVEVLQRLKPHQNTFEMAQAEMVKKYRSLRGAQYYRGVCELLDYGVIARSKKRNVFFINVNMFFNGDRVKYLKSLDNDA